MNELSFLLDILLNHKLGKVTKDAIKARIDNISSIVPMQIAGTPVVQYNPSAITPQQVMQVHPSTFTVKPMEPPPVQPTQIGQTPAAQAALQHRAEMIRQAQTGKPAKGFDTPPKAHGTL